LENAQPIDESMLLKAHTKELIESVKYSDTDFDDDTPFYPDIYKYAIISAGGAFAAAISAMNGDISFSLLRPPGHHSTKDKPMGFCYFNNIAIAAKYIADEKGIKVAIFDFDVHHGNGTEDILLNQPYQPFIPFTNIHITREPEPRTSEVIVLIIQCHQVPPN
jgi:acetoin utilization deacetylase AcuC-like enzyme